MALRPRLATGLRFRWRVPTLLATTMDVRGRSIGHGGAPNGSCISRGALLAGPTTDSATAPGLVGIGTLTTDCRVGGVPIIGRSA